MCSYGRGGGGRIAGFPLMKLKVTVLGGEWTAEQSDERAFKIAAAEAFEKGYGHTVGHSLKRILMSSLEGAAVTSVRVEGVQHEFTTLDGRELTVRLEGITRLLTWLGEADPAAPKTQVPSVACTVTRNVSPSASDCAGTGVNTGGRLPIETVVAASGAGGADSALPARSVATL